MTVRVALVGLGFGAEFIPIYQAHPDVELVAICQRDRGKLDAIGDAFGVERRYTSYEELLRDEEIDAVHLNTPIPLHADQSVAALEAGKHVACTVPMASSVEDCARVVAAADASGRTYMMMETVVYSREFLHVQRLYREGELGRLQFLRGAHHQDMTGWPDYWAGLPPMHYATHAVGPLLALASAPADTVSCVGSGRIPEDLQARYGSPFAVESAHITVRDSDVTAEASRSLFATAREYVESFDVYGSLASFEWAQTEAGTPVLFRGEEASSLTVPDYAHLLPEEIRAYTTRGVYDAENAHLSFAQGSGHGGSHPHLAHEFVRSLVEGREPSIGARTAANWTSVGLLSHESAMQGGATLALPRF
ncbi:Gfo/Idh/MocA family oxidoreductase [Occultella glacieicola]|uniref:Gfo/Idh/MocA family oxidoreductase n=1 Tax=Occultella glacieicola TaxID=2518684 RepID=A0ABY2DYH4_9MICO|nr:Gfo/Idh/MocA family oxidoreductase [Occultella glacieicola]TDE89540.1 Gfo/Idh/MocA family oxidoreductase [Occultella glacieicola]